MRILVLLILLPLMGCATAENHYDPLESMNRKTDSFNDSLDKIVLKPLTEGYLTITPKFVQQGVSNFFDNITYPNVILNDFLQGKIKQGFMDITRLFANTIFGVGGLIDVATDGGAPKNNEDFGQTLAVWGVGSGAYVVYPVFGPNSLRNTPDFATSYLTDGLTWLLAGASATVLVPVYLLKAVDSRARLDTAISLRDELSLDPYVFTRDAWRQRRDYLIYDGNPPQKEGPVTDGFDDENF